MSLTYKVSGRGATGGPAGTMLIFTVQLELDGKPLPGPKKEDLTVRMESPGDEPRTNIMGGTGGSYHVGFKPTDPGQHWVELCWRGTWANEPFLLPVKDKSGKVPDFPYKGSVRGGAPVAAKPAASAPADSTPASTPTKPAVSATPKATPVAKKEPPKEPSTKSTAEGPGLGSLNDLEEGKFTITAIDSKGDKLSAGGHHFEVVIDGPQSAEAKIVDNNNGTYSVSYGPLDAGDYTIDVKYNKESITSSPFSVTIEEEIIGGILSELEAFIMLRGKDGETITTGGAFSSFTVDASSSESASLSEPDAGVYSLNLQTQPGLNRVDVQIGGKSIEGFPLEFNLD